MRPPHIIISYLLLSLVSSCKTIVKNDDIECSYLKQIIYNDNSAINMWVEKMEKISGDDYFYDERDTLLIKSFCENFRKISLNGWAEDSISERILNFKKGFPMYVDDYALDDYQRLKNDIKQSFDSSTYYLSIHLLYRSIKIKDIEKKLVVNKIENNICYKCTHSCSTEISNYLIHMKKYVEN